MAAPTSFDATQQSLKSLLEEAHDGRIQVPEFQRELSLEDEGIKSLLASVSLSYPIGALTILQAGSPDVRFKTRAVAGAPSPTTAPERLLIDGQHRVACLYQVLASGQAVQTQDDQAEVQSALVLHRHPCCARSGLRIGMRPSSRCPRLVKSEPASNSIQHSGVGVGAVPLSAPPDLRRQWRTPALAARICDAWNPGGHRGQTRADGPLRSRSCSGVRQICHPDHRDAHGDDPMGGEGPRGSTRAGSL